MSKSKRQKQVRLNPDQKTAQIIYAVYRFDRRHERATVAAIANALGVRPSTLFREFLSSLVSQDFLFSYRQMRPILIDDNTPEWWIDRYAWRALYSVNLDIVAVDLPDVYSHIASEYGLQVKLPLT